MAQDPEDTSLNFKVVFEDGRTISYPPNFKDKILYAMTSLQMTPLLKETGILKVLDENDHVLWERT